MTDVIVTVSVYDDDRACIELHGLIITDMVDDFYHVTAEDAKQLSADDTLLDTPMLSEVTIEDLNGVVFTRRGLFLDATDKMGNVVPLEVVRMLVPDGMYRLTSDRKLVKLEEG